MLFLAVYAEKPARYDIKIFALVDSRMFDTFNMDIYPAQQADGLYKKVNSSCEIVKRMLAPFYNSGRNVTTNNSCTSYELANDILIHKISIVGSTRKKKRVIPREFAKHENRDEHKTILGFQKHVMKFS